MSRHLAVMVCVILIASAPFPAMAQSESRPLAWDIARSVLLDPTTYAPSTLSYVSLQMDWQTSQVFLDRGWVEQNPRFTVSDRSDDVAVSYKAGNKEIRKEALAWLYLASVDHFRQASSNRRLAKEYGYSQ